MGGLPIVFYFVIEGTQKEIIKKKGARRPDDLAKKKWLAFLERGIKGVVKEGYSKNPEVNLFILDRHTLCFVNFLYFVKIYLPLSYQTESWTFS